MLQPNRSSILERELTLERILNVTPEKLFRCWTEAELLKQWFCPKPWKVSDAKLDVHAGGSQLIVMQSPDGQEFPNRGVYLEVISNQRLVFTDAFIEAWTPSEKPFMVATITFTAQGTKTLYKAVVQHWSIADREEHEKMGFHEGWSIATDQLVNLAASL